jgi:hypothetical protein
MAIKIEKENIGTYLDLFISPDTPIDVFDRPDDDDVLHTYVAFGTYKATLADTIIYSGPAKFYRLKKRD